MSQYHYHQEGSFNEVLVDQLRNAPWFLISLLIHALLLFILSLISTYERKPDVIPPVQASADTVEIPEEEEIPEVEEETEEIEPEEEVTEEPVIKDAEVSDHNETDNEEEWEESKGEEDQISDKPFDGTQSNDAIGTGGGAGGAFGGRRGGRRNLKAAGGGGTQKVVDDGLAWLANHQSPDGRWDADDFMSNGDPSKGPLCDGKGMSMYDTGLTGLALLAFLGANHTHREGKFKNNVRNGLRWLKDNQDSEGCFGPRGDGHFTYNHACAALAMAEAYGMTRSPIWKDSAQQGINFVQASRNPYKAWRYGVRPGDNDMSVSGWMIMALKSAKMAGLDLNEGIFAEVLAFCDEMTDPETGRTGYQKKGELPVRAEGRLEQFPASESESITSVGMLTRVFAGQGPDHPMMKAGAELLLKRLPVWEPNTGKVDMYYWYYGTLSMFQMGGPQWTAWNNKMKTAIIDNQRKDKGNFYGSWDPIGPWGEDGGRVYSTALMTMCLEVYYRYGRVFGTR